MRGLQIWRTRASQPNSAKVMQGRHTAEFDEIRMESPMDGAKYRVQI
jgi:hypothetical protein